MDEKKSRIEKIYSRNNLKIPKVQYFLTEEKINRNNNRNFNKMRKVIKILIVLIITILVVNAILKAIEPVIDKQCISMARSIATIISNEQATKVMKNYEYDDLINVSLDDNGNIKMISANVITVNEIISDIPNLIQEELNKSKNNKFYIKLGTFTGSKILSGRGPNVEIKMSAIGNVETNLKSEFDSSGINQTIHRIYLDVKCNVVILTPFNSIEEQIVNQVLLAEGVIIGDIPDTYYNIDSLKEDNLMDVIE